MTPQPTQEKKPREWVLCYVQTGGYGREKFFNDDDDLLEKDECVKVVEHSALVASQKAFKEIEALCVEAMDAEYGCDCGADDGPNIGFGEVVCDYHRILSIISKVKIGAEHE